MTLETMMWIAIGLGAITASAIINGVEIGCYSLSRVRLELKVAEPQSNRSAKILRHELERPGLILATLLLGNNIVQYISSLATTEALNTAGLDEDAITLVNIAVLSPMFFIFAEAFPKELFRVEADRLTYLFATPLKLTRQLLTIVGFIPIVQLCVRLLEKSTGLQPDAVTDSRQRINMHLKESVSTGTLSESQSSILDRAMRFGELTVAEEMTPWSSVRPLPFSADRATALRIIGDADHARFPVVDRYGKVVGVIRHVDLHLRPEAKIADLTGNCVRLTPNTDLRRAIHVMRSANARFAVVEDQSGRPLGIVTGRDLVEPLTGELSGS